MVGQDLNLDVAGTIDQALDVERAVAKRRQRLAPRLRDGRKKRGFSPHALHPNPAAAFGRFDQDGKSQAPRGRGDRVVGLFGRRLARHDGHARLRRELPRGDLRPHACDDVAGGPMNATPAAAHAAANSWFSERKP